MTDLPVIDYGDSTPERQPGTFRRNHQGAPWVAHPTDTVKPRGNKADLIETLIRRHPNADLDRTKLGALTNDELREWIGSEPAWVLYGRPSSFGKELDNDFNLQRWRERHLVRGMSMMSPDIWLTIDHDDDRCLDAAVARAYDASGTSLAADRGTHVHLLTEAVDRDGRRPNLYDDGQALGIPAPLQDRIINQWLDFRQRLGIEAVRIEQPIVNDDLCVAGTFDRLDRFTLGLDTALGRIESGQCLVTDIKTGNPHRTTYPLQLVAYRDGVPYDPDRDVREEWPADAIPHPGIAAIFHYPLARAIDGEQVDWTIVPVDLTIARTGAKHVADARRYAKRDDVFGPTITTGEPECASTTPLDCSFPTSTTPTQTTSFSVSTSSPSTSEPSSTTGGPSATTNPPPPSSPLLDGQPGLTEARRQQLRDRYNQLTPADQARFRDLGIPADDLDAIEAGLNQIDPFATVVEPEPRQRPAPEPRPVGVDEGEPATDTAREQVRAAWALLEPDQANWVKAIVGQVGNLSIDANPSERRVAIGFALVQLAAAGWHDVELLRACIWHAEADDLVDADWTHARRIADTVQALVNEELKFVVPESGDGMQLIAA